jgi:uracil-DNA glycosylase family 4
MPSMREELAAVVRDLTGHLEWLRENGVREVPAPPRSLRPAGKASPEAARSAATSLRAVVRAAVAQAAGAAPSPSAASAAAAPPPVPRAKRNRPSSNTAVAAPAAVAERPPVPASDARAVAPTSSGLARPLEGVLAEMGDCRRCRLAAGRKNLVFGAGNPKAELVFVGEGPGEDEDDQGIPFVGRAGQLLTKMIEAMGFERGEVYICNVVKCRPPDNRTPEPDEVVACEPFLRAQLASLSPKVIVALGRCAAQTLLRESAPLARLRGNWREYSGVPLMPTFHPAYLLRHPEEKKNAWLDLQLVMKRFGKTPAPGKKAD